MALEQEPNSFDYRNEEYYSAMPSTYHDRRAQIPIRKNRLNYLLKEYYPKETDRWIMFNHPNHFMIYDRETKFCIYDVEYIVFDERDEEDPILAVISKMRINLDYSQYPHNIEDDFSLVSELLNRIM